MVGRCCRCARWKRVEGSFPTRAFINVSFTPAGLRDCVSGGFERCRSRWVGSGENCSQRLLSRGSPRCTATNLLEAAAYQFRARKIPATRIAGRSFLLGVEHHLCQNACAIPARCGSALPVGEVTGAQPQPFAVAFREPGELNSSVTTPVR